jgi:predicted permease
MMKLWFRFRSLLRNVLRKPQIESHLNDEVRSYLDLLIDQKIAAGVSETEARRSALAEFGGTEQVKQAVRDHRAGTGLELLWQDVRYGFRQLRRNPPFTLTAMVTLGLGIGATTSIFSAVYSLLLRPLPYSDSGRLMSISTAWTKYNSVNQPVIATDLIVAQSQTKSFEQLGGYLTDLESNLTGKGDPVRLTNVMVTANFFSMLGVVPQLGRVFTTGEVISGGPPVIILSDHLWRQKFDADRRILGKAAIVNGRQQTIIGVLPAHFSFPDSVVEPDYYAPAVLKRETVVSAPFLVLYAIGRLRPGVSIEQAQAEMRTFMEARGRTSYPADMSVVAEGRTMIVEPLQRHLAGDNRRPLLILLVSVGAVLLIACANVANLQLARAVSRQQETALRGALGASRLRLIRQSLVESLLLSLGAAALSLATAFLFTSLVRLAGAPSGDHPRWRVVELLRLPFGKLSTVIQVDGWVLAFTIGLALLTTVLFGMAPAVSGARKDPRNALQTAALRITASREHRVFRHALLVVEVGLGVVLLVSAGLLIRSFVNIVRSETGFDPSHTLTCVTILRDDQGDRVWSQNRTRLFANQLLEKLKALPSVETATITSLLPLEPSYPTSSIAFTASMEDRPGTFKPLITTSITPDYFRVVGTTILKGRIFNADDQADKPLVSIVNRSFSDQFFAGDALGKRYYTSAGDHGRQRIPATIVGIVDDVKHDALEQAAQPEAFVPMDQIPEYRMRIAVRTSNDPVLLANALRQAVIAVDLNQPAFDIQTMAQRVSNATAQRRLIMLLIACFALLAVILSAVGVYGVFAYSVIQRRYEMGIRLALGASRGGLLRLVVIQAARPITLGCIVGAGAALVFSKLIASLLFGVTPRDTASFSLASALMAIVALLASTIPAAQAARTDLASVLRSE